MSTSIVLVGGGTGGHIYPAVALAEEFTSFYSSAVKIYFMGTKTRLDKRIIPSLGYYYHGIPVEAPSKSLREPIKMLKNWVKWISLIDTFRARKFMKKKRIELVISLGSYISAPILMAAKISGIPYCLVELDSSYGQTNRFFSRWASRLFTCYNEPLGKLPKGVNPIHTGFLCRESLFQGEREYLINRWKLSPQKKTVVILGGSLGSLLLNKTLLKMLLVYDEDESLVSDLQFIQVTGDRYIEEMKKEVMPKNIRLHIVPYVKEMNHLYALADLVIARAGGSTIAELVSLAKPSILIPWEGAKNDHQSRNAEIISSCGGGVVIPEKTLDFQQLAHLLRSIVTDDDKLKAMKEGYKSLQPDIKAVNRITRESVRVVKG